MHLSAKLRLAVLNQHGRLLLWLPVGLGSGIAIYFALPVEPAFWAAIIMAAGVFALLGLSLRQSEAVWPVTRLIALVLFGVLWAALRGQTVAAPVLPWRYSGGLEGRVVSLDRSASDALRVTLDQVSLDHIRAHHTPARVRVSLHGGDTRLPPLGARVRLVAHLAPPGGSVEPGGFDFRRHAWFLRLGAVGYSRAPPQVVAPPRAGIGWLRMELSQAIAGDMAAPEGAVARAITTGDRAYLTSAVADPLRRTNLAHLLAISGLHMGMLTGFVFAALRLGLAMVPRLVRQSQAKKVAALGALGIATIYLALSGGAVATERAYIMVSVIFAAVILDRRAITLRAVALAAFIVLLRRPESLISPGFQLSFAATIALVAVFQVLRGRFWRRPAIGLLASSFIAGAATAPFGAAHFNVLSNYGLLANLLSVPVMATLVMPLAMIAAVLAPLGMGAWPALGAEIGLAWILAVAERISGWPGAVTAVPAPGGAAMPVLVIAALVALLWQGRARYVGVVGMAVGLALWPMGARPVLLISESGKLAGIMGPEGRSLSQPKGDGFAARVWLENDGDPVPQSLAATRTGWSGTDTARHAQIGAYRILHVRGKRALAKIYGCAGADILITDQAQAGARPCLSLDATSLRQSGAIAVTFSQGITLHTAREAAGQRVWNSPAQLWRQ